LSRGHGAEEGRVTKHQKLPLYAEIQRTLEVSILSGAWQPGARVPSEHDLMAQYGCSRMTVNKAVSALAASGLVVRRRRSGSFVAVPASSGSVLDIRNDIQAEIAGSGADYRHEIIGRRQRYADADDAGRLGVDRGVPVLALVVLHHSGGRPFVLEDRLINLAAVEAARMESFAATPPGTWLLAHVPWTEAEHRIRAVNATVATARRLDVPCGSACLVVDRRTWQAGVPITCVNLIYPGDRHELIGKSV
jgi:GntR family transcriptional regulator, histidine utilization repressor